jgi:hypothetical protein
MNEFEGIKSKRFNRYILKNTNESGYPPDFYRINLRVPMDTAVSFLKRFEQDSLLWAKGKPVVLEEVICQLLFIWGKRFPTEADLLKGNIFEPYFKGMTHSKRKIKPKPLKDPTERRGRKPKRQLDLFKEGATAGLENTSEPTTALNQLKQSQNKGGATDSLQTSVT